MQQSQTSPAPDAQPFHVPRNFRITPAAGRSRLPGKLSYYLHSTYSVRNLLEALAVAGVPEIPDPPLYPHPDGLSGGQYEEALQLYNDEITDWGHDTEAILRYRGRRAAVGLGTAETRDLLSNLVLPVALHQEARYLPAPINSDLSQRMWNALESIVVTRNDHGDMAPNYSKLGGTVGAAFIGKSVFADAFSAPELNSGHFVMHYVGYSLLGDLATNTAHELIRAAREPDASYFELHGRATEDSYYPLSAGGKVVYWAHSTYGLRSIVTAGLIAAIPPVYDRPKEPTGDPSTWGIYPTYQEAYDNWGEATLLWKDNLEDTLRYHGRRLIGGFSEVESQLILQNLLVPEIFGMDPRYIPLGSDHPAGQRLAHAFTSIVIGHTDAGTRTLNLPVLGGTVGAAVLAKEVYYPQLGAPALASGSMFARTLSLNFIADGIYNLASEFLRHHDY
ncbi:hypothetical protein D1Y84_15015 [Acidipila sp. EB88]|nr:hypothetical protein D1Y84_15015 [Acidipila sp. EB88]